MNNVKKSWINLLFIVTTLIVNGIGAAGIINGLSQKEISDRYLTLITPNPMTFSIWSLIYIFLIISVITMIVRKKDLYYQNALEEISVLFWISSVFNMVWIVFFSFELIVLSSLFIFAFLINLSLIGIKLRKIHQKGRVLLPITFGLYTGWLMIATVVNIAASLVKIEWNGFGIEHEILAAVTLFIAILLVYLVQRNNKNAIFPLPIAWAYFGIYQFLISPEGFNDVYNLLEMTCIIGLGILLVLSGAQFYSNKFEVITN
jgi:hypothetical protein